MNEDKKDHQEDLFIEKEKNTTQEPEKREESLIKNLGQDTYFRIHYNLPREPYDNNTIGSVPTIKDPTYTIVDKDSNGFANKTIFEINFMLDIFSMISSGEILPKNYKSKYGNSSLEIVPPKFEITPLKTVIDNEILTFDVYTTRDPVTQKTDPETIRIETKLLEELVKITDKVQKTAMGDEQENIPKTHSSLYVLGDKIYKGGINGILNNLKNTESNKSKSVQSIVEAIKYLAGDAQRMTRIKTSQNDLLEGIQYHTAFNLNITRTSYLVNAINETLSVIQTFYPNLDQLLRQGQSYKEKIDASPSTIDYIRTTINDKGLHILNNPDNLVPTMDLDTYSESKKSLVPNPDKNQKDYQSNDKIVSFQNINPNYAAKLMTEIAVGRYLRRQEAIKKNQG